MSTVAQIEAKLIAFLDNVAGLAGQLDHEPRALPRTLPVATLLLRRVDPTQSETGGGEDVTYEWTLSIYVDGSDWQRAQTELKTIVPDVIREIRQHPTCDNLVDFLTVTDDGAEPVFAVGDDEPGYVRKPLTLRAVQTET